MSRRALFVRLALIVLAVGAALWYLVAPPKGTDGYLERLASTAETLRSQVQTVRIWTETHGDGEATAAATLVGLEEAEADADSALTEFQGYEPPSGALDPRSELVRLGTRVTEALSAMRIAGQLGDWQRVEDISKELPSLADELDQLEERARP